MVQLTFMTGVALVVALVAGTTYGFGCKNAKSIVDAPFFLEGPESAPNDDAPSVVECPAGYYAAECHCQNELNCDGAGYTVGNSRQCTAYRRGNAPANAVALVKCQQDGGLNTTIIKQSINDAADPISCPAGYTMVSCSKNDPWSHDRETYFLRPASAEQGFSCAWRRGTNAGPNSVSISAMCVIKKDCCC